MTKSNVLLIIPAYNEQENILNTYNKISEYNSKSAYPVDFAGHLVHNLGIGGAVQTGYKYAFEHGYDVAVQFDGDGQHDINCVADIVSPIEKGEADFVIGSRFIKIQEGNFQTSAARRAGIKLISFFIKITTGQSVYDTTSGFRAVSKKGIEEFAKEYPTEYPEPITTAELLRKGFRMKEVPVLMHEREGGVSSISSFKSVYYMINVLITILIIRLRRYSK